MQLRSIYTITGSSKIKYGEHVLASIKVVQQFYLVDVASVEGESQSEAARAARVHPENDFIV